MNQRFRSSVTVALLLAALSTPLLGSNELAEAIEPSTETNLANSKSTSGPPQVAPQSPVKLAQLQSTQTAQVVKVGERQSSTTEENTLVAKIQAHEVAGRKAATLYVRDIPVLTFLTNPEAEPGTEVAGSQSLTITQPVKVAARQAVSLEAEASKPVALTKTGAIATNSPLDSATSPSADDPLWRATAVAAQINQMSWNGLDADKITVSWDGEPSVTGEPRDRYLIKADGNVLVTLDATATTKLPDTTRDLAKDALQATNRLRRLLGNAAPLREVSGRPVVRRQQTVAFGSVQFQIKGWASWYGPGFDGNRSASGEIFNQNALTAAHRDLPFGTKVRVTNLDNGRTVVVRINDRGPYAFDRIIDLSAAAAQVLGLIHSGVAPVRVDVLDQQKTVTASN
ncbi:septal ring lytic transglycosylase RlpA family protein [Trichocoleus sp. FACHB-591]|uniref:septal ring lytic transglycosylase RlpA family protein n=1 Tax=Trichocoleus sp. FACHB-591 TaxID=2692872 RepID=UPI001686B97A|nr:septal ring lytic transglycosylase RlpA family protein [Trichocoleus sp. FACHB-591]